MAGALETVSATAGVPISLDGGSLMVAGQRVNLPANLTGERRELLGIQGLLPTVPRADDRDNLLWHVIAEARAGESEPLLGDRALEQGLAYRLPFGSEASRAVADAMINRFYNHKDVRSRALLPVHASLPLNYVHTTREGAPRGYRMFNAGILPFLLWKVDGSVDAEPLERLLDVVTDTKQLTILDLLFLKVALEGAPDPEAKPDAEALIRAYEGGIRADFDAAGGAFCQSSMDLFRRDLRTVLDTDLPRPDKIQWLTLLLSLHLTIRLYRIAVVKGGELDLAIASAAQLSAPSGVTRCACDGGLACLARCPFAGRLRFRMGTGRYRPMRMRDECRIAYVEVDQRRLLDMPATLVTATLASRAWAALGGGEAARRRDLGALAAALDRDPELRRIHSAACAAIAVLHHDAWRKGAAAQPELEDISAVNANRPGLHALREDVRRMRRRDLRHQSRDIVNQLVLGVNVGPGALITRNGTLGFYEVDEQMLLLLVRLTCQDRQLPFDSFVDGLLEYGLAPQDDGERVALADALERLGLLVRYSDAGEAAFVHYA